MSHAAAAPRWVLSSIAFSLSSVTAVSVALALHALIDDPLLSALFAAAGVLLDVYKYLAWPLAAALIAARRTATAAVILMTAVALSGVSGWATFDRLHSALVGGKLEYAAIQAQRIEDLRAAQLADKQLFDALVAERISVQQQSAALRARGMATKAHELESTALPRIAADAQLVRERQEETSVQITALLAKPPKAAGLTEAAALLLAVGFALALETVPAALLIAARQARDAEETQARTAETGLETLETPETAAKTDASSLELCGDDAELLQALLQKTAKTPAGQPVRLKEFARSARIGNLRAAQIFRVATEVGALRRTTVGYVAG